MVRRLAQVAIRAAAVTEGESTSRTERGILISPIWLPTPWICTLIIALTACSGPVKILDRLRDDCSEVVDVYK